jgi:hypothetical protein
MGHKDEIRSLKRRLTGDAVVIKQKDGSSLAFPEMEVAKVLFLTALARIGGEPDPTGPVADALANAPDVERQRIESQYLEGGDLLGGPTLSELEPFDEIPHLYE